MAKPTASIGEEVDEKLKAIGGSNLDLRQGPPIHQKRTVTFVNHFVVSMVDFLNTFAQSCEHKLFQCDQRMRKLEDELCLLEAKLNSVPEVRDVVSQTNGLVVQSPDESTLSIQAPDVKETNSLASTPSVDEINKVKGGAREGGGDDRDNGNQVSDDKGSGTVPPTVDITKYLKMIQFGVPRQAVKLKMQQEGLDPRLLDEQQPNNDGGEN